MSPLAKIAFSKRYRSYGICGAFGLSDHGSGEEPDMVQTCMGGREGISTGGGGKTELWVREGEVVSGV